MIRDVKKLVSLAKKARRRAYAPYSKFKVGAARETIDGKIFTGCNVENSAYSPTCCAERTALFKAVSEGSKNFRRIAIVADTAKPCPPCGVCRQCLYEFSPNMEIIMANMKGDILAMPLRDLLPCGFKITK